MKRCVGSVDIIQKSETLVLGFYNSKAYIHGEEVSVHIEEADYASLVTLLKETLKILETKLGR